MRFQCLYSIDYISCQAKLTFNPKGDTRLKTRVGGCITLIAVILSVPLILYYILSVIFHNKQHVAFSTHHSPSSTIVHSYKIPFLFRIINSNGHTVNNDYYHITASFNYKNSSEESAQQEEHKSLQITRCDKSEHLSMFEYVFEQMSNEDVKEYYCLGLRGSEVSVGGEYKVSDSYGYYQFNLTYDNEYSDNESDSDNDNSSHYDVNGNNKDEYVLEEDLTLEIKTLDYTIDNNKKEEMAEGFIHTERFLISSSFLKNIYIHLKQINYTEDIGIIFNRLTNTNFHEIDSIRQDFIPQQLPLHNKQLLISLTVLSIGNSLTIHRSYLKLDEALVFINGILRFVWGFAYMLNYLYSHNYYYIKLLNDFLLVEENKEMIQKRKNYAFTDFKKKTIIPTSPYTLAQLTNKNYLSTNGLSGMNNITISNQNMNNSSCYPVNQQLIATNDKDNVVNLSNNTFTKFNTLHNFINNNNVYSESDNVQAQKNSNQEDNFNFEEDNNKNKRNLEAYHKYAVNPQNKESFKFKQYKMFIPMRFWMISKANQQMFETYIEQLNTKLNIINILKKLEMNFAFEQYFKQINKKMKEDELNINSNISKLQRNNSKRKAVEIKIPQVHLDTSTCLSPQNKDKKEFVLKQNVAALGATFPSLKTKEYDTK